MTHSLAVPNVERARVARHIEVAERRAAAAGTHELPPTTRMVRALLLEALAEYRSLGVFPTNDVVEDRKTPIFIDRFGVRCAMAHLIEISGGGALVERIARDRNLATIQELADEPDLVDWLGAAGLSLEEAAAIQPSYCHESEADQLCSASYDAVYAEATVVAVAGDVAARAVIVRIDWTSDDSGPAVGTTLPAIQYACAQGQEEHCRTVGDRVVGFFTPFAYDGGALVLGVDQRFTSDGPFVAGNSPFQKAHPLPKETALRAVTSDRTTCARILTEADPAWSESICTEEEKNRGDGGCNATTTSPTGLSSAVLLAALLAYRAHRRKRPAP